MFWEYNFDSFFPVVKKYTPHKVHDKIDISQTFTLKKFIFYKLTIKQ